MALRQAVQDRLKSAAQAAAVVWCCLGLTVAGALPAEAQTLPQGSAAKPQLLSSDLDAPKAGCPTAGETWGFFQDEAFAGDKAYQTAQTAYRPLLSALPGYQMKVYTCDLDGQEPLEIVVNINQARACGVTGCLWAVLHAEGSALKEIFLQQASTLTVAGTANADGWHDLQVNDSVQWSHTAAGYTAQVARLGTQVDWVETAEGPAFDAAMAALGQERLDNALQTNNAAPTVYAAYAELDDNTDDGDELFVLLDHPYLCQSSDNTGCPVLAFARDARGQFRELSRWSTQNRFLLLSPHKTDGMHDFVLKGPPGYVVMQWQAARSSYDIGQRTFPDVVLTGN